MFYLGLLFAPILLVGVCLDYLLKMNGKEGLLKDLNIGFSFGK